MGWYARRLLLCLALGLALTIASAWLPGAFIRTGPVSWASTRGFGPAPTTATRLSAPGVDFIEVSIENTDGARPAIPTADEPEFAEVWTPWMKDHGLRILKAHAAATDAPRFYFETRGWPARAAWCEYRVDFVSQTAFGVFGPLIPRGAIALPGFHSAMRSRKTGAVPPRALPYRPIWSGLAINIGFWSAVVAPLVFAPALIRGAYRRWAGACTACGYDLTGVPGSVCPECGRTV